MDRGPALGALTLLAALASLGCQDLTSVDAPDVVQPADYATAAGASALATGAATQFTFAFGGFFSGVPTTFSQVVSSGAMADELFSTSNSTEESREVDGRNPVDPSAEGGLLYTPLQIARINLLTAIGALQRTAPDSSARIGQLFALTGYTELFFGENFCAGVPLSRLDASFRPLYGEPLTTEQMYQQALVDFDSAQVYGADSLRFIHLAAVGRGRVLLNQGRFSEAATAVAGVPTNYVYNATFVTGTLHNGLFNNGTNGSGPQNFFTVPEREGPNGLNWRSSGGSPGVYDPRAVLVNRSPAVVGLDGTTQVWQFAKYQESNAPIRLATGIEARLIEAEAALQAGNAGLWLSMLNTLRTNGGTASTGCPDGAPVPCAAAGTGEVNGLPALAEPGTPVGRVDLHFRERAFWLFLTGHRHGDLRRLVRQYGRDAETVFPTGAWKSGLPYGAATNMAPSAGELNNPNYSGCLNRDA